MHHKENDNINASALPPAEDSRTIGSSSFIVTEEPIISPTIMSTSLSINNTNDNSIHRNNSRLVI